MAFVYCHAKNCNWSQDDFWDFSLDIKYGGYFSFCGIGWKYNPISEFLSYVLGQRFPRYAKHGYWWPRRIMHDKYCMKDYGWSRPDPYSWYLIWYEFKKMCRKFHKMKWRTYLSFEKDPNKVCPVCGSDDLDID
jgi:hypothetical protein